MKKCKIISLNIDDDHYLIDKVDYYVADHPDKERIISEYIAQGYEVKNFAVAGSTIYVYLEKDI